MRTNDSAVIRTIAWPGLGARAVSRQGCEDLFITANASGVSSAAGMFAAAADLAAARDATVVSARVFGVSATGDAGMSALRKSFGEADWPLTWIDEGCRREPPLAGIALHAVCGPDVAPVRLHEQRVGSLYEDAFGRYCVLDGLGPRDASLGRKGQTWQVFEDMVAVLAGVGMTFADVVRTWFWNDDILDWYDEFNQVRTEFFEAHSIFDGLVPASTGIGGHNAAGSALAAALYAVQGKGEGVEAFAVPSPLQCPAGSYGSSFSRAVELAMPGFRQLLISGTASIAAEGETMHTGDVDAQIARTMDVVAAILDSRDMSWADVTGSIVYYRHSDGAGAFRAYCDVHGVPRMPALLANTTICRDDLLFEIEADAIVPK